MKDKGDDLSMGLCMLEELLNNLLKLFNGCVNFICDAINQLVKLIEYVLIKPLCDTLFSTKMSVDWANANIGLFLDLVNGYIVIAFINKKV